MANNFKEQPKWEEGIYELKVDDPVLGGEVKWSGGTPSWGHANAAASQLANRTRFLRDQVEGLANGVKTYETKAEMDSDTSQDEGTYARVINDEDDESNGYYSWDGSSWSRTKYQPATIEKLDELIKEVETFPFQLNQLQAQINAYHLKGMPIPSFYQEFGGGASLLDPRLTFSRPSKAWGWRNGVLVEYDVNEPVFEDGGLRLEPQATNYVEGTEDMYGNWSYNPTFYDSAPAESVFGAGYTAVKYTKISTANPQVNLVGDVPSSLLGKQASVTVLFEADLDALEGDRFSAVLRNLTASAEHTTRSIDYQVGVGNGISLESLNAVGPNGHPLYRIHAEFEVPDDGDTYRFYVYMFRNTGSTGVVHHYQVVEGHSVQSPIITPTGGTATRAADQFQWTGASFDRAFNPSQGAFIFKIGENSGLPYVGIINPFYAAALWTGSGSVLQDHGAGVYVSATQTGRWRGFGVKAPNKERDPFAIVYPMEPGDTVGLSWQGETISLFVNGALAGSFTHPDVIGALQAVKRFHVPDAQHMYLERPTMFSTRPTDDEMEALTHA